MFKFYSLRRTHWAKIRKISIVWPSKGEKIIENVEKSPWNAYILHWLKHIVIKYFTYKNKYCLTSKQHCQCQICIFDNFSFVKFTNPNFMLICNIWSETWMLIFAEIHLICISWPRLLLCLKSLRGQWNEKMQIFQ